jgi:hypothetical protein
MWFTQILTTMVTGNLGLKFFLFKNLLWLETSIKHCKNRVKSICDLKKPNSTWVCICFFTSFKDKKTSNMNSPHQMKQFDTNIVCFDDLNRCQRYFSLFITEIRGPLSLYSLNQWLKNKKNKLLYKI